MVYCPSGTCLMAWHGTARRYRGIRLWLVSGLRAEEQSQSHHAVAFVRMFLTVATGMDCSLFICFFCLPKNDMVVSNVRLTSLRHLFCQGTGTSWREGLCLCCTVIFGFAEQLLVGVRSSGQGSLLCDHELELLTGRNAVTVSAN